MCGFVGVVGSRGRQPDLPGLHRMLDVIAHRGPDDSGTYMRDLVGFGFRRLAIQDLSPAGHQPMQTEDGQLTVVYNGEIYNFVELRSELETLGHQFKSSGDTEVLLHAYQQWGVDCVSRFNGMWAFLIHDRHRNLVFGSRDRFGIKPLFRYKAHDQWVFASEIKSLRKHVNFRFEPNKVVAAKFLFEDKVDEQIETFYEGVTSIPAGCCFEVDPEGRYREWKYWDLHAQAHEIELGHDAAEEYAALFEDAIRICLRSDVPLAVFLSGGMDSSSILCSIARQQNGAGRSAAEAAPTAFGYMDADYDENKYVADSVAWSGANLKRVLETPLQLWDDAHRMLAAQDEPVHSFTPVVGYALSKMTAAHGIKVVLNGQGADETAGGYPSYFANMWQSLSTSGRLVTVWNEIGQYTEGHGGNRLSLMMIALRLAIQTQFARAALYRQASRRRKVAALRAASWYSDELGRAIELQAEPFRTLRLNDELERSVTTAPLPLYLRAEDRNSMAHSLEFRLPFLDYRLVRLLFALPPQQKLSGKWNKYIMRQAMKGRIPESVRMRVDKMGFPTQFSKWIRNDLKAPISDLLASRALAERGWFDAPRLKREFDAHCRGEKNIGAGLFRVIQMHWWLGQEN